MTHRGGPAAPKSLTLAKLLSNPLMGSAKGSSTLQDPPPQMQGHVSPGCLVSGLYPEVLAQASTLLFSSLAGS